MTRSHTLCLMLLVALPCAAAEPFAFADFTWLNGNSRQTEFPLDSQVFTGSFTLDTNYEIGRASCRERVYVLV